MISFSTWSRTRGIKTLTGVSVPIRGPRISTVIRPSAATNDRVHADPGRDATCTGSYTVTQADIDNNGGGDGDIDNTATADSTGTEP